MNKPNNSVSYQYTNSKGHVWMSYGNKWGITVIVTNDAGNVVDSWDGKLESMPARFNKGI